MTGTGARTWASSCRRMHRVASSMSMSGVQLFVESALFAWPHDYNHHRPHGSLGHLTPSELIRKRADQQLQSRPTPV